MKNIAYYQQALKNKVLIARAGHLDYRSQSHYLVIESDDWGTLRMPSTDALHGLVGKGLTFFTDIGYDKYDTLESDQDVEILMEVLESFHDRNGNPAIITLNGVVANPDFDKIKKSNYSEYHYETIEKTYSKHAGSQNALNMLKDGINRGCLRIQYHGREHLNVPFWLRLLRDEDRDACLAFEKGIWSMKVDMQKYGRNHALAAYDIDSSDDSSFVCSSLCDGLDLFEHIYGYRPISMISPNYTWDDEIELSAFNAGIRIFQGDRMQRLPAFKRVLGNNNPIRYTGEKNKQGQIYLVRNCLWEPSQRSYLNSDYCLAQISKAFKQGKPAIISAHRLNFIGGLDEKNRFNNINDFKRLLKEILQAFPDVVFMSSDVLGKLIMNQKNK